jgi:hypothetical protein
MHHHVQVLDSVHIFEYPMQIFDQKLDANEIQYKQQMWELIEYMRPRKQILD